MDLTLRTDGLRVAPAQVWGNVRLVPLLRDAPIEDLRLGVQALPGHAITHVRIDEQTSYLSYVPHGLVVGWSDDGAPLGAIDTQLGARSIKARAGVVQLPRMVRRLSSRALRFLPLHFAMEGYLSLHFGGPDLAHRFWSHRALRDGLSPRSESSVRGRDVPGLAEALAIFERHLDQCGVLVFIGDHLASATVVSHPDDYAALHDTLVADVFGTLFAQHGWAFRDVPSFSVDLEGDSLEAIRASLGKARTDWAEFAETMASGIFGRTVDARVVRRAGSYRLVRFGTGADIRRDEHLGEALIDGSGRIAYLKTYRLDRGQVRRARILDDLSRADWDPEALAETRGHGDLSRIAAELDAAGLGWMAHAAWEARV